MNKRPRLIKSLEAYGLNKKQAKVYLACLEAGLSTVQNLAGKSGLKRTTIYSLLEEMEKMGIINIVKQGKKTFVTAQSPEALLADFNDRREKIIQTLPDFQEIKRGASVSNPKFIFYRGREGFKNFWRDLLRSGAHSTSSGRSEQESKSAKEWLISTSGKEFLSFVSESYITNWIIKEKKRLGIKSRQLISDSLYAREIIRKDRQENRESKIVDSHFPLPAIEIIFGDKVAIISSNFENMLIVIESKEVAQTHRSYFEMIWQFAARPTAY